MTTGRESGRESGQCWARWRRRPLIAVTSSRRRALLTMALNRIALWRAGARTVRLYPGRERRLDDIDGVLIGGGGDIAVELYDRELRLDTRVNSLHHQAVRAPGAGLRVVARDEYGVIQAIEDSAGRPAMGVQWHPEFLVFNRGQQGLFRWLVARARRSHRRRREFTPSVPADPFR